MTEGKREREGESLNRRRFLGVRGEEEMPILGPAKGVATISDYCSRCRRVHTSPVTQYISQCWRTLSNAMTTPVSRSVCGRPITKMTFGEYFGHNVMSATTSPL